MMKRRAGFTLIELLVVIAIIAVLIALLLPAIQAARESAQMTQCRNNLKQIGLALTNYHDTANMFPYSDANNAMAFTTAGTQVLNHSGWPLILPFIERQALYDLYNFEAAQRNSLFSGWSTTSAGTLIGPAAEITRNATLSTTIIDMFLCPSDPGRVVYPSVNNYYGCNVANSQHTNYGFSVTNGAPTLLYWNEALITRPVFGQNSNTNVGKITDGTSKTAMVVETTRDVWDGNGNIWGCSQYAGNGVTLSTSRGINDLVCCGWDSPPNSRKRTIGKLGSFNLPGSAHAGGCHALLADGSVRFLSQNIDAATRRNLTYISDGNQMGEY